MKLRVKPSDDLKVNAAEFDKITRGGFQALAPAKNPQTPCKKPKK